MADIKAEQDLEKALDESLDALAKSAEGGEAEDAKGDKAEDEDAKGDKPAFLKKDDDKKDDKKKDEDEDAKGDKKEPEEAKSDKKEDVEKKDEDEDEKSMRDGHKTAVHATLTKSETVSNAIEVSKFLREVVKSLSDVIGEQNYRLRKLEKSNASFRDALVKSQGAQNDILKSFGSDVAIAAKAPLARKGLDAKTVSTIEKSFRNDEVKGSGAEGEMDLTKSQIAEKLCDLEIGGKVPHGTTTKFEATGELNKSFAKLIHEAKP
jgi:hypothetical protein